MRATPYPRVRHCDLVLLDEYELRVLDVLDRFGPLGVRRLAALCALRPGRTRRALRRLGYRGLAVIVARGPHGGAYYDTCARVYAEPINPADSLRQPETNLNQS